MTTEERKFTISVFTENKVGLLNRITGVFTRRHVSIDSLTVSESEVIGIFRFTITCKTNRDQVTKIVKQLEKLIEVVKSSFYEEDEIIQQEVALYKVPTRELTNSDRIEKIVRKHNARILFVGPEILVIEKTGHKEETQNLFNDLDPFGVLEFVRSGRIAINKTHENLHTHLDELEKSYKPLIQKAINHGKN
jgi:acetolactate synthase-1/3 small subunit